MLGHCNLTSPVHYYDEDMQHNTTIRKCVCKKEKKEKQEKEKKRFAGETKWTFKPKFLKGIFQIIPLSRH